jgi:RecA/RadA recombinase
VRFGAPSAEPLRRLPVGIAALDGLLDGGLPRGHLSEIVGGRSSGRTAVLHALLTTTTRAGAVAALVDLPNALDPPSLARAGAVLERVLWVRPPAPRQALQCAELILAAGGFALVALDLDGADAVAHRPPPRAAWLRLAQAARRADAAGIVLGAHRQAGAAAALALRLQARRVRWSGQLLDGLTATATLDRSRFGAAERLATIVVGEDLSALSAQIKEFSPRRRGDAEVDGHPRRLRASASPR